MATDKAATRKPSDARTLKAAHEVADSWRPKQNAPLSEWLTFRRATAALYTQIADIDRFHHHEAMYWAEREQEIADELAARSSPEKSQ
ncbi:MAG: AMED_5909 family protein [Pseudonocardiaceae bacterium]